LSLPSSVLRILRLSGQYTLQTKAAVSHRFVNCTVDQSRVFGTKGKTSPRKCADEQPPRICSDTSSVRSLFCFLICSTMAESLSPECTPLKHKYDTCFNAWFEGYLEPAVAASSSKQQQQEYSKRKADEFQETCGKVWESYRECVQVLWLKY
jgi:TRIAP1/MDM35 family protein